MLTSSRASVPSTPSHARPACPIKRTFSVTTVNVADILALDPGEHLLSLVLPFSASADSQLSLPTDTPVLPASAAKSEPAALLDIRAAPLFVTPGGPRAALVSVPTPSRLKSAKKQTLSVEKWAVSAPRRSLRTRLTSAQQQITIQELPDHEPWEDSPLPPHAAWKAEGSVFSSPAPHRRATTHGYALSLTAPAPEDTDWPASPTAAPPGRV
jgi:hypothetical protein